MTYSVTPTQQRILKVLSDGKLHPISELITCLWDEEADDKPQAVRIHLSRIKKVLAADNHSIITTSHLGVAYYQVTDLASLEGRGYR